METWTFVNSESFKNYIKQTGFREIKAIYKALSWICKEFFCKVQNLCLSVFLQGDNGK